MGKKTSTFLLKKARTCAKYLFERGKSTSDYKHTLLSTDNMAMLERCAATKTFIRFFGSRGLVDAVFGVHSFRMRDANVNKPNFDLHSKIMVVRRAIYQT